MASATAIFFMVGALLFFALMAEYLYRRLRIPDVLLLIGIGILIGPVLGWVPPAAFEPFSAILVTFALLFLAFEGAIAFDIRQVSRNVPGALQLAILHMILTTAVTVPLGVLVGLHWKVAVLLGVILSGTASEVVGKLLSMRQVQPGTATLLGLEASISDVLAVLGVVVGGAILTLTAIEPGVVANTVLSAFAVAMLIGVVVGFLWARLLLHTNTKHAYVLTIAMMLLVYSVAEFSRSSGVVAAIAFALVLGNSRRLFALIKGAGQSALTSEALTFYDELAFLVSTFFFIYVGVIATGTNPLLFVVGSGIVVLLLVVRRLVVRIVRLPDVPERDKRFLNVMVPRGLSALVLAQVASRIAIPTSEALPTIVLAVVVVSLIVTSVLTYMATKNSSGDRSTSSRRRA